MQINLVGDPHQKSFGDTDVEQVLQVGGVAARLAGEAGGVGRLKTRFLEGGHHFVFEFAQVGAELGFEVGAANTSQVPHQLLLLDQPIHRRMDQRFVPDIVEL